MFFILKRNLPAHLFLCYCNNFTLVWGLDSVVMKKCLVVDSLFIFMYENEKGIRNQPFPRFKLQLVPHKVNLYAQTSLVGEEKNKLPTTTRGVVFIPIHKHLAILRNILFLWLVFQNHFPLQPNIHDSNILWQLKETITHTHPFSSKTWKHFYYWRRIQFGIFRLLFLYSFGTTSLDSSGLTKSTKAIAFSHRGRS